MDEKMEIIQDINNAIQMINDFTHQVIVDNTMDASYVANCVDSALNELRNLINEYDEENRESAQDKLNEIANVVNENKYDGQEFGASYGQLSNDIDEIRDIINR